MLPHNPLVTISMDVYEARSLGSYKEVVVSELDAVRLGGPVYSFAATKGPHERNKAQA